MRIELKVPEVGESITDVEIAEWLKHQGDTVGKDEPLVSLESAKANVELPAPQAGTLVGIVKQKGEVAQIGEVIGYLESNGAAAAPESAPRTSAVPAAKPEPKTEPAPAKPSVSTAPSTSKEVPEKPRPKSEAQTAPAIKTDQSAPIETPRVQGRANGPATAETELSPPAVEKAAPTGREEEVVPMSRLRRTVAERLVTAQHNAALLTTFNEIDMAGVSALRKEHGEAFMQRYNVKLGMMSFFVKASIDALKQFPAVNAEVRGNSIVYHNYFDIGIAVGSGKGLVVPVLRNAERLSLAEVELAIHDFAYRAKENKLKVEELEGGTFTISNGGVYGSLLSTPIINPPQSGILGLHAIQERPIARDGNVLIRPMMYVALTYDHRIVDGREAVSFLKRIKEAIENPARMLIEI